MTGCISQPADAPAGRRSLDTNSRTIGPNPLSPDLMTTKERLDEVCRLLALGLIRLRMREAGTAPDHASASQSTELSAPRGESSLPFPPDRSGHANPTQEGKP